MTSYSFFIPFPSFSLSTLPCVLYIFIEGVWRVLHTSCGWGDFYRGFVGEKRSVDKNHKKQKGTSSRRKGTCQEPCQGIGIKKEDIRD